LSRRRSGHDQVGAQAKFRQSHRARTEIRSESRGAVIAASPDKHCAQAENARDHLCLQSCLRAGADDSEHGGVGSGDRSSREDTHHRGSQIRQNTFVVQQRQHLAGLCAHHRHEAIAGCPAEVRVAIETRGELDHKHIIAGNVRPLDVAITWRIAE
jgi:hypothetical protein